jgi:hypothetical protein
MLQGYVDARAVMSQETSIYGGVAIKQRDVYDEDVTRILGSHNFEEHNGYYVFNKEPNWADGVKTNIQRRVEVFKALAIEYVKTYQSESDLLLQFDHLFVSKLELYEMVSFFNAMLGRWKPFWIPTWTKDIVVTEQIADSDTTLTIEDMDYGSSWSSNETVGKWIYFLLPDNTEAIREVTGWPTATTITIDSGLGVDVSEEALPYMVSSFLVASRFNSDELEINHMTSQVSEVSFNTISLPDETMSTTTTTI